MKTVNGNNREFEDILASCLERLLDERVSLDDCLKSYPEYAAELETLLKTALATHRAVQVAPGPEFKMRARYQFREALHEVATRKNNSFFSRFIPHWAVALAIVLVVVMAGGGTVAAASDDMPDSMLYPVKLASENVRLVFSFNQGDKVGLMAELADRRVTEIVYMAERGDEKQLEVLTHRLDMRLSGMAEVMPAVYPCGGGMLATSSEAPTPRMEMAPAVTSPMTNGYGEAKGELGAQYDFQGPPDGAMEDTAVAVAPENYGNENTYQVGQTILHYAWSHPERLRNALEDAPPPAHPAMERAIDMTMQRYQTAITILQQNQTGASSP